MKKQNRRIGTLLFSIFVIAICGIVYELIIAGVSSYLLGDSITQFSLVIGFFMSAMGLGSFLSKYVKVNLLDYFVGVEMTIGFFGGFSALALFYAFGYQASYHFVMFTFIIIIGAMVGLEIPILTRIVKEYEELRVALANVLSFDYIGALIGSIAFPIILLPRFGLIKTALLVGCLNILVAWVIYVHYRRELRHKVAFLVALLLITVSLVYGLGMSHKAEQFLEQKLYSDKIIFTAQSPYQKIVLTQGKNDFRLFINGNLQFSSFDEYRYHEALVHPAMLFSGRHDHVLVLGGGDGLAMRELLRYSDVEQYTLVDLDPMITQLALENEHFRKLNHNSLHDPRVHVVNQDAYQYMLESEEMYNVILVDLPDPNSETLNKLYTSQFYNLLQKHLTADGAIVIQSTSPYFAPEAFWSIVKTVEEAGLQVYPYHVYVPSFGDWGFTLATRRELNIQQYSLPFTLKYLNESNFAAMFTFGEDVLAYREAVEPNQMSRPVLLEYYQQGWKHW